MFLLWFWRRLLRVPWMDYKETQPVHPKGNQSWIFIGRTESEAPILWPPDAKSQLTRKHLDAWKDWRWEEKGMTEDEIVGWHHPFNSHELEQTRGDGKGQASTVCCCPWGHKESDMAEWLNNNKNLTSSMDRVNDQYGFCSWYDTYLGKISISNFFSRNIL